MAMNARQAAHVCASNADLVAFMEWEPNPADNTKAYAKNMIVA